MFGIRSILALVIGTAVAIAIVIGAFTFLEKNNPAIDTKVGGQLLLLGITLVAGLAGGFAAATIAAKRRRLHAIIVGILLCALGLVSQVLFPDRISQHNPAWYNYGIPVLSLVAATLGGRLRSRT